MIFFFFLFSYMFITIPKYSTAQETHVYSSVHEATIFFLISQIYNKQYSTLGGYRGIRRNN